MKKTTDLKRTAAAAIAAITMALTSCSASDSAQQFAPTATQPAVSSQTEEPAPETAPAESTEAETSAPEESVPSETEKTTETTAASSETKASASSKPKATTTTKGKTTTTSKAAKKTATSKAKKTTTSKAKTTTAPKKTAAPKKTTAAKKTTTAPQKTVPTDLIYITGEELLIDTSSFINLTGGNYSFSPTTWFQDEQLVNITSPRMPGVSFIASFECVSMGEPENGNEFTNPADPITKYTFYPNSYARVIELTGNAMLNDRVNVGMTYSQLLAVYGDNLKFCYESPDWFYATVPMNSDTNRYWTIEFILTEDQKNIIKDRIDEKLAEDPSLTSYTASQEIDISDIDPTSTRIYTICS